MSKRNRQPAKMPAWMSENLPPELAESSIFVFDITLPSGDKVKVDLRLDVDIDYELLEQQMEECPAQFVWYASLYSEMKSMVAILERKVKAHRGRVAEEVLSISVEKQVKLTVDQVKMVVEADERLDEYEMKLAVAQKYTGKLYFMVEALRMKSELLRSLAGFKRSEREAQR